MKNNNQSGFTLIEVLISMVILSIGLLGLSTMQGFFAHGNAQSREMTRATDIAVNHIETLANLTNTLDPKLAIGAHGLQTGNFYPRDYNLSWSVVDNLNNTLSITVTVSWNKNGRPHRVIFPWIKDI
jgi:type IV pilus assembly protein PilV